MRQTITPKSDQLNYDDFIGGTKTITITGVKGTNDAQQPVKISFEGDNGKPYKPCKSMRRVMVQAWGANAIEYVGRSMTLYGDPNVTFGGAKVGGIRISHMSHIENDLQIPLTVSKARRAMFPIKVLKVDMRSNEDDLEQPDNDHQKKLADDAYMNAEQGLSAYQEFWKLLNKSEQKYLTDSGLHDQFKEKAQAVDRGE